MTLLRSLLGIVLGISMALTASGTSAQWWDEDDADYEEREYDDMDEQYEDEDREYEEGQRLKEDRRAMEAEYDAYLDNRNYYEGGPPGSGCDPNYGMTADGGCVMNYSDFDCAELWDLGIGDIPVVGSDWMRLDGYQDFETGEWISTPDGWGCEWEDARGPNN